MRSERGGCSGCSTLIAFLSLVVAIVAVAAAIIEPEIRCELGLECPATDVPPDGNGTNDDNTGIPLWRDDGPRIVEDWDSSGGGFAVYFCEGMLFDDGTPITSRDMQSFIRRGLSENFIENEGVEIVDDLTIIIQGVESEFAVRNMLRETTINNLDESSLCG